MKRALVVATTVVSLSQHAWTSSPYEDIGQWPLGEGLGTESTQQFEPNMMESPDTIRPLFESGEHKHIGDKLQLRYDNTNVSGADFGYSVANIHVSLGEIVALAGDFYGNPMPRFSIRDCNEQISDAWASNQTRSIEVFSTIANQFRTDPKAWFPNVLSYMRNQTSEVDQALGEGRDPAQAYHSRGDYYNTQYSLVTAGIYPCLAWCNYDHFGTDAVHAYSAGHSAALRQALQANQTGNSTQLHEAYFLEGFALHYLTDLFAAGHLREPRRKLHNAATRFPPSADSCGKRQHDEDNANGLWVKNSDGEAWPAYGDAQLLAGKSKKNLEQAVTAAQIGINEVWNVYKNGSQILVADFAALRKIPDLTGLNELPNFVPLFLWNESDGDILRFRNSNFVYYPRRNERSFDNVSLPVDLTMWDSLLDKIDHSANFKYMLPFSQSFLSKSNTLHLLATPVSAMAINIYGPLDPGPIWNMRYNYLKPGWSFENITWNSMNKIGTLQDGASVFSLVGTNGNGLFGHVGFSVGNDTFNVQSRWKDSNSTGHDLWTLVDVVYGTFNNDSTDLGMIKSWNDSKAANELQLFSFANSLELPPVQKSLNWTSSTRFNAIFPYRIQPAQGSDTTQMLVTLAFDSAQNQTLWNFTYWSNGYERIYNTTIANAAAYPVQTVLTGHLGNDTQNSSIIRLYYGATYPVSQSLRIQVDRPTETTFGQVTLPSTPHFDKEYSIRWSAYDSWDYFLWFLADVDNDGNQDLVTYTASGWGRYVTPPAAPELHVIVFPGQSNGTFIDPVVSNITFPTDKGSMFNEYYMLPVYTRQAEYSSGTVTRDVGILCFFDNFGVLGARMLAPMTMEQGNFSYEFKGQTPAIAGQVSQALGWRGKNSSGRGEPWEAIGFAEL